MLGGTSESRVRFLRAFKRRCRSFKVLVESISISKAVFLDLELSKGDTWRRDGNLDVSMHIKSTALGIPLSDSSSHPPNCHNWPVSRFYIFGKRVSSKAALVSAQNRLISDLVRGGPDHVCINLLKSSLGYRSVADDRLPRDKPRCSWLVVPFHKIWHNAGLGGVAKSIYGFWSPLLTEVFEENEFGKQLDVSSLCVGISWALGGRHLTKIVKSW